MSEFDWIACYFAPLAKSDGAAGLTDDAAQISGKASIVTVDALVEGVHFLPDDPIDTVARKLVRVNVSDIIAKGARPDEALLTLGWPKERSETDLAKFAEALGDELALWGIRLIGGDTVTHLGRLFLSLTLTGRLLEGNRILRRSGAKPGDVVCVTGKIGVGGLGLTDAQLGRDTHSRQHYRVPNIPPLSFADFIGQHATAAMDVSDGLIADAKKLAAASKCTATLYLDQVPVSVGHGNLQRVLDSCTAGDDYQCLFALPRAVAKDLPLLSTQSVAITPIGKISEGDRLILTWQGKPMPLPKQAGFTH